MGGFRYKCHRVRNHGVCTWICYQGVACPGMLIPHVATGAGDIPGDRRGGRGKGGGGQRGPPGTTEYAHRIWGRLGLEVLREENHGLDIVCFPGRTVKFLARVGVILRAEEHTHIPHGKDNRASLPPRSGREQEPLRECKRGLVLCKPPLFKNTCVLLLFCGFLVFVLLMSSSTNLPNRSISR